MFTYASRKYLYMLPENVYVCFQKIFTYASRKCLRMLKDFLKAIEQKKKNRIEQFDSFKNNY